MPDHDRYDYIVVGSGAGGGPVASRLARAGFQVLLMEAGGRPESANYAVPAFHPFATEDRQLRWDYYVRHYDDTERSRRDPKFVDGEDGVLYPRSGTLGGCTAHHALITVTAHDSDWDHIAELTGDDSWSASAMRRYFQHLERKRYGVGARLLYRLTRINLGRHGYNGWLPTVLAPPSLLLEAPSLRRLIVKSALRAEGIRRPWMIGALARLLPLLLSIRDINAANRKGSRRTGVRLLPVSVRDGRRYGTRELIEETCRDYPDHLHVKLNALVTGILFSDTTTAEGAEPVAVGVRYRLGAGLYAATPGRPDPAPASETAEVRCRREVIISAGAFNTPQLLMLSGVGPAEHLAEHGITVRAERPGVGRNLQDRYEVGVISKMKRDFALLDGARFKAPDPGEEPDPLYRRWLKGSGPYSTNGIVMSVILRSDETQQQDPDLICLGLTGDFRGYYPGYTDDSFGTSTFTWAVLKAHTANDAGSVTLASADPLDRPHISFRYFDEGSGAHRRDLDAVVKGLRFVRELNRHCESLIERELYPGPAVTTTEELERFVLDGAWGHHASGTCRIGRTDDPFAVLDSRFRVIGVQNLRVVDASVFPRIPGFFIAAPIYTVAEKAAELIIADAGAG